MHEPLLHSHSRVWASQWNSIVFIIIIYSARENVTLSGVYLYVYMSPSLLRKSEKGRDRKTALSLSLWSRMTTRTLECPSLCPAVTLWLYGRLYMGGKSCVSTPRAHVLLNFNFACSRQREEASGYIYIETSLGLAYNQLLEREREEREKRDDFVAD